MALSYVVQLSRYFACSIKTYSVTLGIQEKFVINIYVYA